MSLLWCRARKLFFGVKTSTMPVVVGDQPNPTPVQLYGSARSFLEGLGTHPALSGAAGSTDANEQMIDSLHTS